MLDLFKTLARFAHGLGFGGDRLLRSTLWLALTASLLTGVANTAVLALINRALTLGPPGSGRLALTFAGLCLLLPATRWVSQVLLARLGQGSVLGLRLHLAGRLVDAPLRQVETVGSSRALMALTEDAGSVAAAVTDLPLLAMHATILLSCFVYLGLLSWLALLGFLGSLLFGVLSYQVLLGRVSRHFRAQRQAQEKLVDHFRSVVMGNKELKLNSERRAAFLTEVLEPTLAEARRSQQAAEAGFSGILIWGRSLFFIIAGLIVFAMPALGWGDRGVVTGYALVLLFMIIPLETVLGLLPDMGRAWVALRRIEEVGLSLAPRSGADAVEPIALPWGPLVARGLRYAYEGEAEGRTGFEVGPLDIDVPSGQILFVIGGNGSGKTTLGKLLVGLYAADDGELELDGLAIGEPERPRLRQCFHATWSDVHLFPEILGQAGDRLDDRAGDLLRRFGLPPHVQVAGGKFSTLHLSQGQRKRLALVLAYLEDRPAYLFDEWAADQDHEFKRAFYRELLPELKGRGKTVVVITHDDHYFEAADRIVKLDRGQVVFDGLPSSYLQGGLTAWSLAPPAMEPAIPIEPVQGASK